MEDLLTIEQTAEYLQVSVSTVRRMVRDGRLRSVSLGRLRRVPRSALKELIAQGGGEGPRDGAGDAI